MYSDLVPTVLNILAKSALKLLALVFVSFICVPWSVINSLLYKEKMPVHLSICSMNPFNRKLDTRLCCIFTKLNITWIWNHKFYFDSSLSQLRRITIILLKQNITIANSCDQISGCADCAS